MKKIIILTLFIYLYCPVNLFSEPPKKTIQIKPEDFLTEYRNYLFLWIYPEYYYSADIIPVQKEKSPPNGYTKIEFFGLSAFIPSLYTHEITRKYDRMYFKSKTGDWLMMLKASDSSMLCSEKQQAYQKDYCSAFKTVQEYNHKLFTLTPDTVESVGDKWIVHGKGLVFQDTQNIKIYSSDKFMAYVRIIKDSLVKEKKIKFSHEITLFHVNGPINSHITICFLANDDTLLNHFISTIE
ncbi:MAG: hypothetical protein KKD44_07615 [Proteobacteria bacterium]|nr:hypothetical protein [Pseudomonadota bacterium]